MNEKILWKYPMNAINRNMFQLYYPCVYTTYKFVCICEDNFRWIEKGSYISNLAFRQMVNGMFAFDKYICIKHECKVRRCYLQI